MIGDVVFHFFSSAHPDQDSLMHPKQLRSTLVPADKGFDKDLEAFFFPVDDDPLMSFFLIYSASSLKRGADGSLSGDKPEIET